MRHKRYVKKLGVKTAHRHAMMANMATSLILAGKITTTVARAKVVQSKVEKLITLAKRGDLHARRQVVAALRDGDAVTKLFSEIVPEFKETKGGYTRRALWGRRLGDGATMAVVELNIEKKVVAEPKKKGKGETDEKAEAADSKKEKKAKPEKKGETREESREKIKIREIGKSRQKSEKGGNRLEVVH
jgi:large subunit ribosomal protein L17